MMPLCSTLYKLLALRCSESCWSLRKGLLQRVLTSRMRSVYRHITWLLTTRRLVTLAEVRNHLSRFLHDVFNNGLAELYTSRCTSWSTCSAMHTKLFHFSVTRCTHHIGGVVSYTHMDIFFAFFAFFQFCVASFGLKTGNSSVWFFCQYRRRQCDLHSRSSETQHWARLRWVACNVCFRILTSVIT